MSAAIITRLIVKDWSLERWPIVAVFVAGAISLVLLSGGEGSAYAGFILLLTIVISAGAQLAMVTVVNERKEQKLAFIMSLPISPMEYTTAKVLANLLIFLVPFLTLMLGSFAVIAHSAILPDGVIPFAAAVLMELFVNYCLLLAVALVSESQAWSVGAIVAGNLFVNGFIYVIARIPSIASAMKSPTIVWNEASVALLLGEVAAAGLLLGLTFYLQSRKTDFV